jgi:hypothetical protein
MKSTSRSYFHLLVSSEPTRPRPSGSSVQSAPVVNQLDNKFGDSTTAALQETQFYSASHLSEAAAANPSLESADNLAEKTDVPSTASAEFPASAATFVNQISSARSYSSPVVAWATSGRSDKSGITMVDQNISRGSVQTLATDDVLAEKDYSLSYFEDDEKELLAHGIVDTDEFLSNVCHIMLRYFALVLIQCFRSD